MHCHMEIHQLEGMTMIIHEGKNKFPRLPKNFPNNCGSFTYEPSNTFSNRDVGSSTYLLYALYFTIHKRSEKRGGY